MMSTGNAAATLDLTLQQETRKQTPLEKFKALCRKHMVIYDDRYIDVIFGSGMPTTAAAEKSSALEKRPNTPQSSA